MCPAEAHLDWNGGGIALAGADVQDSCGLQMVCLPAPFAHGAPTSGTILPFSGTLTLRGTEAFQVASLGQRLTVDIASPWPSPSFVGATLPLSYQQDRAGFGAHWRQRCWTVPSSTGFISPGSIRDRSFVGQDGTGTILTGTTKDAFFSLSRLAIFLRDSPLGLQMAAQRSPCWHLLLRRDGARRHAPATPLASNCRTPQAPRLPPATIRAAMGEPLAFRRINSSIVFPP